MKSKFCSLLAVVLSFSLFLSQQPFSFAQSAETRSEVSGTSVLEDKFSWRIEAGDWLYADVSSNTLWIVRGDESAASQPYSIGSGINNGKKITWLGRTYDPITPENEWLIKSKNQQNECWVFCANKTDENGRKLKDQTFLRLYPLNSNTGDFVSSKYGIHSTPRFNMIVEQMGGFGSYGCLLTDYDLLKFLEQIFDHHQANGEEGIRVVTSRAS